MLRKKGSSRRLAALTPTSGPVPYTVAITAVQLQKVISTTPPRRRPSREKPQSEELRPGAGEILGKDDPADRMEADSTTFRTRSLP